MKKMSLQELKTLIENEFKDVVDPAKMKIKQLPWWQAKPENEIDWIKQLRLKEIFKRKLGK